MLRPTIFIGLGSTGTRVVSHIERDVYAASGSPDLYGAFRYFALETDGNVAPQGMLHLNSTIALFPLASIGLAASVEALLGAGAPQKQVLDNMFGAGVAESVRQIESMITASAGAGGRRVAGRLLFDASYQKGEGALLFARALESTFNDMMNPDFLTHANARLNATAGWGVGVHIDANLENRGPQVVVIMTGAGGTGSGIVGQVAWLLRRQKKPMNCLIMLMMPSSDHYSHNHNDAQAKEAMFNAAAAYEDIFYRFEGQQMLAADRAPIPDCPVALTPPNAWSGGNETSPWYDACILLSTHLQQGATIAVDDKRVDAMERFSAAATLRLSAIGFEAALVDAGNTPLTKSLSIGMTLQRFPRLEIGEAAAKERAQEILAHWLRSPEPQPWPTARGLDNGVNQILAAALEVIKEIIIRDIKSSSLSSWPKLFNDDPSRLSTIDVALGRAGVRVETKVKSALKNIIESLLQGRTLEGAGSGVVADSFDAIGALFKAILDRLNTNRDSVWKTSRGEKWDVQAAWKAIESSNGFTQLLLLPVKEELLKELSEAFIISCLGKAEIHEAMIAAVAAAHESVMRIIESINNTRSAIQPSSPISSRCVKNVYPPHPDGSNGFESAKKEIIASLRNYNPSPLTIEGIGMPFWFGVTFNIANESQGRVSMDYQPSEAGRVLRQHLFSYIWKEMSDHLNSSRRGDTILRGGEATTPKAALEDQPGLPATELPTPKPQYRWLVRGSTAQPNLDIAGAVKNVVSPLFEDSEAYIQIYEGIAPSRLALTKALERLKPEANYEQLRYPYDIPLIADRRLVAVIKRLSALLLTCTQTYIEHAAEIRIQRTLALPSHINISNDTMTFFLFTGLPLRWPLNAVNDIWKKAMRDAGGYRVAMNAIERTIWPTVQSNMQTLEQAMLSHPDLNDDYVLIAKRLGLIGTQDNQNLNMSQLKTILFG